MIKLLLKLIIPILVITALTITYVSISGPVTTTYENARVAFEQLKEQIMFPVGLARLRMQEPLTQLPIPVQDVRLSEIVDTWGAPRPTGRGHNGVDIFAERGRPIISATPGYVTRKGIGTLGGNYVFVSGPGGLRYYYAHRDSFAEGIDVGTEVTDKTILGYVGNTGNAITTPPHLHFGIYQNGAENPFPLLVERE